MDILHLVDSLPRGFEPSVCSCALYILCIYMPGFYFLCGGGVYAAVWMNYGFEHVLAV